MDHQNPRKCWVVNSKLLIIIKVRNSLLILLLLFSNINCIEFKMINMTALISVLQHFTEIVVLYSVLLNQIFHLLNTINSDFNFFITLDNIFFIVFLND